MELIDIGANLTHVSFEQDRESVIDDARQAGVAHIILTGTDLASSTAAQAMAQQDPSVFSSTAGFHPHIARDVTPDTMEAVKELLGRPEVVAVGETGLDFHRNFSPPSRQLEVFQQHLELAASTQKPIFLHQREAHEEFLPLLRRYRSRITGGVVHCFTDSDSALQEYLALEMYIGITGWVCDERRGLNLQRQLPLVPDDRLLIETDAPFLLPRSLRPKPDTRRNEPKYLIEVARKVAQCREQSLEHVAALSTANARRLFGLS